MISSHLLSEIEQVATQVGIIANGEMLFQDAIGELRSKADTKIVFSTSDTDGALDIFSREGVEAVKTQRGLMIEDRTDMEISGSPENSLKMRLTSSEFTTNRNHLKISSST